MAHGAELPSVREVLELAEGFGIEMSECHGGPLSSRWASGPLGLGPWALAAIKVAPKTCRCLKEFG